MSNGQTAQSLYFCEKSQKNRFFVHEMLIIGYWHVIVWPRVMLTLCENVVQ